MTHPLRSRPRPAVLFPSSVLALCAALAACGGGGGTSQQGSTPAASIEVDAPRTAPAIPVAPQPLYAASGAGSYQAALEQYNRVGEALHGQ